MTNRVDVQPLQTRDPAVDRWGREVVLAIKKLTSSSGGVPATATPLVDSGAGAVGTTTKYAREDHVHPSSSASPATATPLIEAGAGAVGVATKYAREDHVHPLYASAALVGIDYTVDFTSKTRDYKTAIGDGTGTAGDNPQTVPFTITANNGTTVPTTLSSGLTITPFSSANANVLTCGFDGLRNQVIAGAPAKLCDMRMTFAHLGIDRTRPFAVWFLLNRVHVNCPGGSEIDAIVISATANVILYAQHSCFTGSLKSSATVFVNGTYAATPFENPEVTDNVKVARFYGATAELYSLAASAFPTSSSLASLKRRGRASGEYLLSVKAAPVTFPADDDIFGLRTRADTTSCDSAYYQMRVVQGV